MCFKRVGERIFIHNDLFCIMYIRMEMQITCVASGKSNYVFGDRAWRKTFRGILLSNVQVLYFLNI